LLLLVEVVPILAARCSWEQPGAARSSRKQPEVCVAFGVVVVISLGIVDSTTIISMSRGSGESNSHENTYK
jgi:hypothetical protein